MTERDRVLKNNKGEIPEGQYDIVRIVDVKDPKGELQTFKDFMITFIDNKDMNDEDESWEEILPVKMIRFTNQLEDEDYHKDDLIAHICPMIFNMQKVRKWEWYSSKLIENGFEVVVKGVFRGIFLPILHHMGIAHKSLFIETDGVIYDVSRAGTDVMTYKTFDPKTFELKRK